MNKKIRQEVIDALIARDGYRCMFPGCELPFTEDDPPTIDHWNPFSVSRDETLENLVLMHFKCNNIKGDTVPNIDGTLTVAARRIKVPKIRRPEVCNACMAGRILLEGEECPVCGSGPQPPVFHTSMKKKPKNCPHSGPYWCMHCCIGLIPRRDLLEI
jgi:hypothetical protein